MYAILLVLCPGLGTPLFKMAGSAPDAILTDKVPKIAFYFKKFTLVFKNYNCTL